MGDGRYRSDFEYERSESDSLDRPRSNPRYSPDDVYAERRYSHSNGRLPKKRPTAGDYFENRLPSLKKKPGWNQWTSPALREQGTFNVRPAEKEESDRPGEFRQPSIDGKETNYGKNHHNLYESSAYPNRRPSSTIHPDRLRLWQQQPELPETEEGLITASASPINSNPYHQSHSNKEQIQEDMTKRDHDYQFPVKAEDSPINGYYKVPHEIMDPRLLPRKDNPARRASTDNTTAQNVNIDTSISSPGTLRSREQTPTRRPQTTFAVPPLPVSAGGVHIQGSESSSRDMANLIQYLSHFAQSVTKEGSLTMQYDAAAAKLEKKKTDLERWRPHHDSFTSLAEEQEKEIEKSQIATERLAERCRKHGEARDKIAHVLATTLFSISTGSTGSFTSKPENEFKTLQLEKIMNDVSDKVHGMQQYLNNLNLREESINSIISAQDQLTYKIDNLKVSAVTKESYADLTSKVSSLTVKTEKAQDLQNGYDSLSNQVDSIKKSIGLLPTLRSEMDECKKRVDAISGELESLKNEITGDGQDDAGLVDLISKQRDSLLQFKKTILDFDDELSKLDKDVTDHSSRIIAIESNHNQRALQKKSDTLPLEINGEAHVVSRTTAEIARDLKLLRDDQEQKDEMVSQEFESLAATLKQMNEAVAALQTRYSNVIDKIDTGPRRSQGPSSHLTGGNEVAAYDRLHRSESGTMPMSMLPSQLNPLQVQGETIDERSHTSSVGYFQAFEQLYSRVLCCESTIAGMQRRLDILNSNEIASNVSYQMQRMFPRASDTQIQTRTFGDSSRTFSEDIAHLSTRIDSLSRRVTSIASNAEDDQKEGMSTRDKKQDVEKKALNISKDDITNMELESRKNIEGIESRINLLNNDCDAQKDAYNSLDAKVQGVEVEAKEAMRALLSETETIKVRLTEYEETALNEFSKLNAKVELLSEHTRVENLLGQDAGSSARVVSDLETPSNEIPEGVRSGSVQPEPIELQQRIFKKSKRPKDDSGYIESKKKKVKDRD